MRKQIVLLLLFTLYFSSLSFSNELSFEGYVRNYTGITINDEVDFSVVQNTFDLTMEFSMNNFALLVNPNISMNFDNMPEFDLREAYIDIYLDYMDFRIGQQQIIWGKADGAFITDVVSPKNLTEFILPEFEEIRMGVTAVKADLYIGNSTLEFIWVPLFTPNKMPDATSIWNPAGIDFSGSDDAIAFNLTNGELFGRFSLFTSFMDFEIMGGYMWDDEPTIIPDPPNTQPLLDHKRLGVVGGSFSSAIGPFILRGEGAFYTGKYFQADAPGSPIEKNYINYLAGIDFRLSDWYLSTQFIQKIILDYDATLIEDQITNTMTYVISKEFLRNTLRFEIFAYVEFNNPNALLRPKISYELTDGLELSIGSNLFIGDEGTFGQFYNNNSLFTKLKFSF